MRQELLSDTIQRYIHLLEKAYVIFTLRSLSRSIRNELKKSRKIYFYDNGVRNAIISNFQPVNLRLDIGALRENFLTSERRKFLNNRQFYVNTFFWRTKQQQEIDYIEERDSKLYAFEFKWRAEKSVRFSKTFTNAYPQHELKVITKEDYFGFLSSK